MQRLDSHAPGTGIRGVPAHSLCAKNPEDSASFLGHPGWGAGQRRPSGGPEKAALLGELSPPPGVPMLSQDLPSPGAGGGGGQDLWDAGRVLTLSWEYRCQYFDEPL